MILCSSCRQKNDRPDVGRYCTSCHAAYMVKWRLKQKKKLYALKRKIGSISDVVNKKR
jgi:hypothetical protein